jgi:DNA-binding response OmpR family regulator
MNQKNATVLYVDDNAKARRLLDDVLTAWGFRVITARDSLEAHFGRDTVLDDLLGTMWSLVRSNRMSASDRRAARLWANAT